MLGAVIGLAVGWVVINVAILVWARIARPEPLELLGIARMATVTTMVAAGFLTVLGIYLGRLTAPALSLFIIFGCYLLLRLNAVVRSWAP